MVVARFIMKAWHFRGKFPNQAGRQSVHNICAHASLSLRPPPPSFGALSTLALSFLISLSLSLAAPLLLLLWHKWLLKKSALVEEKSENGLSTILVWCKFHVTVHSSGVAKLAHKIRYAEIDGIASQTANLFGLQGKNSDWSFDLAISIRSIFSLHSIN